MANPTTNYGWVMPTATDLVTDLPADFNTFGQAVDTSMAGLLGGTTGQVLSKTSGTNMAFTWINNDVGDITGVTAGTGISGGGTSGTVTITNSMATEITAAGDIIVGTGSGTFDNLPIGTTAQVLTADTTVSPYKVKWATVPTSSASFTQLAATATTTGSTVTVTGLSGYNTLWISWEAVGTNSTAEPLITLTFNSDSASNYYLNGRTLTNTSTTSLMSAVASGTTSMTIASQGSSAGNNFSGGLIIQAANTTGVKVGQVISGSGGTNATARAGNFRYTGTSVISSVSITTAAGSFDEGTLRVIGSVI